MMVVGWRVMALALSLVWLSPGSKAWSQDFGGLGVGERTPIEISADSFEVRPQRNVGIFEGRVRAIQGRLTLTADIVEVHYAGQDGGAGEQGIRSLEAKGNVQVASPDEQAQGAWARYDVAAQTMVLGGGVLLTRGPNVLEGARLAIDLKTNVSRLTPFGSDGEPKPAAGPEKGRVRAIFTPPAQDDDGGSR